MSPDVTRRVHAIRDTPVEGDASKYGPEAGEAAIWRRFDSSDATVMIELV